MSEEHTFPIAEEEAQKLDNLTIYRRDDLKGRVRAADLWIRDNALLATGIALAAGLIVGAALKR